MQPHSLRVLCHAEPIAGAERGEIDAESRVAVQQGHRLGHRRRRLRNRRGKRQLLTRHLIAELQRECLIVAHVGGGAHHGNHGVDREARVIDEQVSLIEARAQEQ